MRLTAPFLNWLQHLPKGPEEKYEDSYQSIQQKVSGFWIVLFPEAMFASETAFQGIKKKGGSEAWAPGSKMALSGPRRGEGGLAAAYWAELVGTPGWTGNLRVLQKHTVRCLSREHFQFLP